MARETDLLFPGHPEYEHIRTWIDPYPNSFRLELWDTLTKQGFHWRLAYQLWDGGKVIFQGHDFGCPPQTPIDSDECIASLLSFLSLRPGDTDREYFDDYTKEQMNWCQTRGEELGYIAMAMKAGAP